MEFLNAGLPVPVFSVRHGEFKVIMKNGYHTESASLVDSIIEFCSVPRSRAELISFAGKSRNYVMGQIDAPLVESGRLKLTMPEKPKSSNQKYVKA
jgi:ATP-dependent DNA helicase RecG